MGDRFNRIARAVSHFTGTSTACILAVLSCVIWAIAGPFTGYSDTWMLTINTGTTIVTFWMGFIIQSTQNRDSKAIHLKLDELIDKSNARNKLIDLENAPEDELQEVQAEFQQ